MMDRNPIFFSLSIIIFGTGVFAGTRDIWEDSLANLIQNSRCLHIPVEPLENKVHEGRAKKRSNKEIYTIVKLRQQLLLQIQAEHKGSLPGGYEQRLFHLERVRSLRKKVPGNTVTCQVNEPSRKTEYSPEVPSSQKYQRIDSLPATTFIPEYDTVGTGNENNLKVRKQMQKNEELAEKNMKKAASRAEKRMKTIQKRLQKKVMKRNRGN